MTATNARRHRPGLGRLDRGDAARDDLRLRDARRRPTRATPAPIELGVKFTTDFPGTVTGIRFYKAAAQHRHAHRQPVDRRRHAARPGHVHRTSRRAAGSTCTFASPVAVTADTTYVASYFAPNGHYSVTSGGFSSAVDNPPLHALANGTSANGVLRLRRREHASRPRAAGAANYWVDVLFAAARRTRAGDRRRAPTAGQSSATVNWTAPASGGPVTSYKITPYIGAAAQTAKTITGSPPATLDHGDRAHRRDRVHVPRAGLEPERLGPGVRALQQRDAAVVGRPVGPDGRDRPGRLEVGDRPLDGAGQRRRQPDHRLHRHAVRRRARRRRPSVGAPTTRARDRADQRHRLHVHGHRDQRRPGRAPRRAPPTRSRRARRSSSSPRRRRSTAATRARSCSASSSAPTVAGSVTGLRFYKAAGEHGHARRHACGPATGTLLAEGDVQRRDRSGWQALTFAHAGRDHRRHDLRRELPRAQRPLLGHRRGVRVGPVRRTRRCARSRRRTSPNGVYAYSATPGLPDRQLQRHATTGWTSCSPRRHDRARRPACSPCSPPRLLDGVRRRRPAAPRRAVPSGRSRRRRRPANRARPPAGGCRRARSPATTRSSSASRASRAAASRPATS